MFFYVFRKYEQVGDDCKLLRTVNQADVSASNALLLSEIASEKQGRMKLFRLMNYITSSAPRFNCVEGIILKHIIFNFHRKFLATLIPESRRKRRMMLMEKWKHFAFWLLLFVLRKILFGKEIRCVIADISTFDGASKKNRLNIFHVAGRNEFATLLKLKIWWMKTFAWNCFIDVCKTFWKENNLSRNFRK